MDKIDTYAQQSRVRFGDIHNVVHHFNHHTIPGFASFINWAPPGIDFVEQTKQDLHTIGLKINEWGETVTTLGDEYRQMMQAVRDFLLKLEQQLEA